MHTLFIRYVLDPDRLTHFRTYVDNELKVIRRSGGKIVGYFLPTDFAGSTDEAFGLIEFATLASYEQYRKTLASDPDHRRNITELERSGAVQATHRSIIERVDDPSEVSNLDVPEAEGSGRV